MDYFYVEPEDIRDTVLLLRGDEYRHLSRVLRKKVGDHIFATDGRGSMYEAIIRAFDRTAAECSIVDKKQKLNEPKIEVTLAISLLRNPSRFDFVVEKATELGATSIIPLISERTIPQHEKHTRLEKIALAALKQSGRCVLPRIFVLTRFETLVEHSGHYDLKLIPHEKTEQSQFVGSVMKHHPRVSSVLLVVGPEGGFTDEEVVLAGKNGFISLSLGPRRLRSETAALSALSWVVGGW